MNMSVVRRKPKVSLSMIILVSSLMMGLAMGQFKFLLGSPIASLLSGRDLQTATASGEGGGGGGGNATVNGTGTASGSGSG